MSLPAKHAVGATRIAPDLLDVAFTTSPDDIGNLNACGIHEGVDKLEHRNAIACTEVIILNLLLRLTLNHAVERTNVSLGKVGDIDVVTDAGSIGSMVVVAKNIQFLTDTHCRLANVWKQVLRNATGKFADLSCRMSTDGVEIAENDGVETYTSVEIVLDDLLGNLFGVAVRRSGRLDGSILVHRALIGLAIDGAGA